MKKLASLVGLMMLSTAACAAPVDEDDTESSEDELRTLSVQSCRSPSVTNAPQRSAAGTPIEGTARTTVEGCVLGGSNESGKDVVDRVAAMFKDASTVGNMRALDGKKVFKSFSARASSGTLASGIT